VHRTRRAAAIASNGKKKTTMAKLNREHKLREKRAEKAARKDARRLAAARGESIERPAPFAETTDLA
jgi:hypothetical protein